MEVAKELNADKSNVLRDVRGALSLGLLVDLETRKGLPRQLMPGGEMGMDSDVLPDLRHLPSDGVANGHSKKGVAKSVGEPVQVVYNHTTVNGTGSENKDLTVVLPKYNHIQLLHPSQNQGDTEADDPFNAPIDYEAVEEVDRWFVRKDQTRHVMNTLKKFGPQTRQYLAGLCCKGSRQALDEILGALVKRGDVTVEGGQVHCAKAVPAASSSSAHVPEGAVMLGETSAN